jgi:hypothetical protein
MQKGTFVSHFVFSGFENRNANIILDFLRKRKGNKQNKDNMQTSGKDICAYLNLQECDFIPEIVGSQELY